MGVKILAACGRVETGAERAGATLLQGAEELFLHRRHPQRAVN